MENINPSMWGNRVWTTCYSFIAVYPNNPTNEHIQNMILFFKTLKYLLPCETCRVSYSRFTSENDTNVDDISNFKNRNNLIAFIYNLRRKVERKVGLEYYSSLNYLTFKINNMVSSLNNKYEYEANNIHECAFIPSHLEDSVFDYIKKYKDYVDGYDYKNTKSIISKLKLFLQNPESNIKYFPLWIERNNKCRKLINQIEKNMSEKNYDAKKSISEDRKLHVQLFYLGSTIISTDDLAYLLM